MTKYYTNIKLFKVNVQITFGYSFFKHSSMTWFKATDFFEEKKKPISVCTMYPYILLFYSTIKTKVCSWPADNFWHVGLFLEYTTFQYTPPPKKKKKKKKKKVFGTNTWIDVHIGLLGYQVRHLITGCHLCVFLTLTSDNAKDLFQYEPGC